MTLQRNNQRPFDHVLQFSDIAGPVVSDQGIHCFRRDCFDAPVHTAAELLDEIADEQSNVFTPFMQWGTQTGKTFTR